MGSQQRVSRSREFSSAIAAKKSPPLYRTSSGLVFPGAVINGVDMDQLCYFGASVFWRAAAYRWHEEENNRSWCRICRGVSPFFDGGGHVPVSGCPGRACLKCREAHGGSLVSLRRTCHWSAISPILVHVTGNTLYTRSRSRHSLQLAANLRCSFCVTAHFSFRECTEPAGIANP